MEDNDSIAKLRNFAKLDFQSKKEVINDGRSIPELNGLLQTTGQKLTRSFKQSGTAEKTGCVALWLCGSVLQEIAFSAVPVFCPQHLNKMSGLAQYSVT